VIGCHTYHDIHNCLPISYFGTASWGAANNGKSWMIGVLPFVEQKPLYDQIRWDPFPSADSNQIGPNGGTPTANTPIYTTVIKNFLCPSDGDNGRGAMNGRANLNDADNNPRYGITNYKGCCGANWGYSALGGQLAEDTFPAPSPGSNDGLDNGNGWVCRNAGNNPAFYHDMSFITDGTSNTFCVGEAVPRWCTHTAWCYVNGTTATCGVPLNYKTAGILSGTTTLELSAPNWGDNYSFFSRHPNGGQFGMCDGAVKFVPDQVDFSTYKRLATCAGGRPAALPE
jgi:prepilin-type processing-associated H-X9-DG protein